MYLPWIGCVLADDALRVRVDRAFHSPMIVLALCVLPLLLIEFLLFKKMPDLKEGWLGTAVQVALWLIWTAFFVELVIKVTIAESRFEYLRRHWIDVLIVVLPLLRPLRITRLARTARVFTLRGVGMKMFRSVAAVLLGAEIGERLAQRFGLRRDGRPDPRRMTRLQLENEVKSLRGRIDAWEVWFDEHRTHREAHGVDHHFDGREQPERETTETRDVRPGPVAPDTEPDPARPGRGDA